MSRMLPLHAIRKRWLFRSTAVGAGLVCLAACANDGGKNVLEECRTSGLRFYSSYSLAELNSPAGRYLIECMAHHGYEFSGESDKCDSGRPLVFQEACFEYVGMIRHLLGRGASAPGWLGKIPAGDLVLGFYFSP